jgi:Uma2 family endonuclease
MTLAQLHCTSILPLENGDRLSSSEFEQRYEAMSHCQKAELIEGRVYMAAAVRARKHSGPHAAIMAWLSNYWVATLGTELFDNPTVRLNEANEPQPDACLCLAEAAGGQARIDADDYIAGAPELIVEVAASSASYDLHEKKQVYCSYGVREYLVWRTMEHRLDWFVLEEGVYWELPVDSDGLIRSKVFPGLWLSVADLLGGNLVAVTAGLKLGLVSSEYQVFEQDLEKKLSNNSIDQSV